MPAVKYTTSVFIDVSNVIKHVTDEFPEVRGGWEQFNWSPFISSIRNSLPFPRSLTMKAYMSSSGPGRANQFQLEAKRALEREGVEVFLLGRQEADPVIERDLKHLYETSLSTRNRRDPEKRKIYIVLVSGDADFLPALQKMNRDDIHLSVWAWEHAMSRELLNFADSTTYIDLAVPNFIKP